MPSIRTLRILSVKALFVELPAFERHRSSYLDDDQFRHLQLELLVNPERGDVISGTGGLRKIRFADERRGKGKRGGLRIVYYWWRHGGQFWFFAIYDKDEMDDLSAGDKKVVKQMLEAELEARR